MLFRMQSNMLFRLFPLLTAQAGFAPVDICLISENCYKSSCFQLRSPVRSVRRVTLWMVPSGS